VLSLLPVLPALLAAASGAALPPSGQQGPRVWQSLELSFHGPAATETDNQPNPFLDYRFQGIFTAPDGRTLTVPGFYAGDGAGGGQGDVWRLRFTPDQAGRWSWRLDFRAGSAVAVDLAADAGTPLLPLHGLAGVLEVAPPDPAAPGFLGWGFLRAVGRHHFRLDNGAWWIKTGTNSPENLLAYRGFAGVVPGPTVHDFAAHEGEWCPGDPDWGQAAGRGIIGALNHLAERGVNSVYFLPMNIGGDGQDTWPYVGPVDPAGSPANDNLHFAIGRLAQWELVFAHAQRRGVLLHFVLSETEEANKRELDDGALGVERKLYFREMVARFGHHPGLQWNLCEEYDIKFPFSPDDIRAQASWLQAVDPYDHPITVHNYGDPLQTWMPFVGDQRFGVTSLQYPRSQNDGFGPAVEFWRLMGEITGWPIPVSLDEFRRTNRNHLPDQRRDILWPVLLSGGQIEFILAELLAVDDFSPYDALWEQCGHARSFLELAVPFQDMEPADGLVSGVTGVECLALPGSSYGLYLPQGGTVTLDLRGVAGAERFRLDWFNPRTGLWKPGAFLDGGALRSLGPPPWPGDVAACLRNLRDAPNAPPTVAVQPTASRTVLEIGDEDGLLDLDLESLVFSVGDSDRSAELRQAVLAGLAQVEMPTARELRIILPLDLTAPTLYLEIRDRGGFRAGVAENKP